MPDGAISRRRFAGYAAGAAATGVVAVAATPTPAGAVVPPMWFDIRDYGAVGNGGANDTAAIQAAVNAAAAATTGGHNHGAVVYAPAGVYDLHGLVTFPPNKSVDLVGCGRWQTRFRCRTAGAGFLFGNYFGFKGASSGQTGGFWIGGTPPFNGDPGVKATNAMIVSTCSNRTFYDIQIDQSVTGLRFDGVQNALVEGLLIKDCTTGLVLDFGAGGNTFVGAQLRDNATNLVFTNTWDGVLEDTSDPVNYPQYNGKPTDNKFLGGIIEHGLASPCIVHEAGEENYFVGVRIAGHGIMIDFRHLDINFVAPGNLHGLKGSHNLYLIGCFFVGGPGTALRHTCPDTHVWVTNCMFKTLNTAFRLGDRCYVDIDRYYDVDVANRFVKNVPAQLDGEEVLVRREAMHTHNVTRPNAGDVAFRTWVGTGVGGGRQNHAQFTAKASGEMAWGQGTSAADVTLKRSGNGVLQSNGKLTAAMGLGVGNSQLLSMNPAVSGLVRRIQVFDADGSPLGYIPVYTSIT